MELRWIDPAAERLFNRLADECTEVERSALEIWEGDGTAAIVSEARLDPRAFREKVQMRLAPVRRQMAELAAAYTLPPGVFVKEENGIKMLVREPNPPL